MGWWRCLRAFFHDVVATRSEGRPDELVVPPELTAPDVGVLARLGAARDALRHEDVETCTEVAAEALAMAPGDLFASYYLGQALVRGGQLDEARSVYLAAAERDPFGLAAGWLAALDHPPDPAAATGPADLAAAAIEQERAARAALRRGDFAAAADAAAAAVRLDPQNLVAYHLEGQALLALDRLDEAVAVYESARPYAGALGLVEAWIATARQTVGRPPPAPPGDEG